MCGVGLGAMHRAWVSLGGWMGLGLCVGSGRARGRVPHCCGLGPHVVDSTGVASGAGSHRRPSLGPPGTRVSWGSFGAQLKLG